jgi:hypothetical protein
MTYTSSPVDIDDDDEEAKKTETKKPTQKEE